VNLIISANFAFVRVFDFWRLHEVYQHFEIEA